MAQQIKIEETPVIEEEPIDSDFNEAEFQDWYKQRASEQGLDPNPDDPLQFYDYRSAYKAGAEPDESGHWPSEFKLEGHPNLIVDGVNTKTGEPVEQKSIWQKAIDIANWPSERIASGVDKPIVGPGFMEIPGVTAAASSIEHAIDPTDSPFYTGVRPFVAGGVKLLGDTLASGFDPRTAGIRAAPDEAIVAARSKFKPKDIELPSAAESIVKPAIQPKADIPLPPEGPVQKFKQKLKESKPLNKEQKEIYRTERAEKFSKAGKVEVTDEASAGQFMSQLAGKHTKVSFDPLRDKLDEADVKSLFTVIGKHPDITVPETARAIDGLRKVLDGSVPQPNEVRLLENIFGPGIENNLSQFKRTPMIMEAVNIPKVIQSAWDLSIPLRQARPLMHTKSWWGSWDEMVRSFGSQKAYDGIMESIAEKPLFQRTANLTTGKMDESYAEKVGLAMTDLTHTREETAMSRLAMKIPGIKASNRAASAYLNKLRADTLESLVETNKRIASSALKLAKTPEEVEAAKLMDPMKNLVLGNKVAKYINSATGRGDLGSLNKVAEELNLVFYSPKLIKSRMDFLNPRNYISQQNAGIRKEYLKSALSIAASWTTMTGLAAMAGAETTLDSTSSDFGKIKIGNTRFDPGASFQQFLVFLDRLRNWGTTSSTTGKFSRFGEGYKPDVPTDLLFRFLVNKLAPIPHYMASPFMATEYQPFRPVDEAVRLAMPLMTQDLIEVSQDDPNLLPLVGIGGVLGLGAQTYGEKGKGQTVVPEEFDMPVY